MTSDSMIPTEALAEVQRLLAIMAALRTPGTGCPWDLAQRYETIVPHTIEEAYELAEAVDRRDMGALREEAGDLLFQTVFYARLAQEDGHFDFAAVVRTLNEKMLRRHPHVFGPGAGSRPIEAVNRRWQEIKATEKEASAASARFLEAVPRALPAATVARKLQERAAEIGFDWPAAAEVMCKIEEEVLELRQALPDPDSVREEIGDLMFAIVNLARHLKVDVEAALRHANEKFRTRFTFIEESLAARGRSLQDAGLSEMEALWQEAKKAPR